MDTQRYKELLKESKDYLVRDILENDREFEAMREDRADFRNRVEAAERRLELVQKKVESLQVEKRQIQGRMNSVKEAILTIKTVHYSECYTEGENPRKTKERLFLDHLLRIC